MRHNLRPLFDRIVIKELDPDRIRRSGLVVPPGDHEPPPQHGIVLAIGPGIDWWEGAGVSMPATRTWYRSTSACAKTRTRCCQSSGPCEKSPER